MKKGILFVLGTLFVITIFIGGCSKSEEKNVETPPVEKQMTEEKGSALKQEAVEKTEPMTEQTVETAKEMGQLAMEGAVEKMQEEVGGQMEEAAEEGVELPVKN